ncbi:MAG: AMP-binding protein [Desulfobulbaceae bacterium]|nr:AMP-binding protein [Desulfobulbaceae bacterium]HIJ78961.1 AMP-binding protein [Deltaproteobacteria bacterium]
MTQSFYEKYNLEDGLSLRRADLARQEQVQVELLQMHLMQAANTHFYRNLWQQVDFSLSQVDSLADLQALPMTSRQDLDAGSVAFIHADAELPADITLTSGTTGEAIIVPYTAADLDRLAFNEMMAFYSAGVRPGDRVLLCVTLDRCFIAGLAYYSGIVKLGATAVRSGPGNFARQWELIHKLKPAAIVGVPSFLLKLAQWGEENGTNPQQSGVGALVTIGEPIRKSDLTLTPLGQLLEEAWGAKLFSSYGATELETAFGECAASCGGHVHPELMMVEIIDDQGNPVSPGNPGEVVVTPLGVKGFPLVRFRTGDVARLHVGPCACGWQTPRLGPIEGRLAQRLKYKGTTLYPEMIFQALDEVPGLGPYYVEVHSAYDLSDEVRIVIGADEELPMESISALLQARLRVRPVVVTRFKAEVVAKIENTDGRKIKKFFDLRKVI